MNLNKKPCSVGRGEASGQEIPLAAPPFREDVHDVMSRWPATWLTQQRFVLQGSQLRDSAGISPASQYAAPRAATTCMLSCEGDCIGWRGESQEKSECYDFVSLENNPQCRTRKFSILPWWAVAWLAWPARTR
jgi:hypothetical protein